MKALDLFDLNAPKDLFDLLGKVFSDYCKSPSERDFLLLVLGLTHLREWLVHRKWKEIHASCNAGEELSPEERFFVDIYDLPEFQVVQSLCNRSKHHITKHEDNQTSKISGLRAGLGRAGDRLGQTYFLIDGKDSRVYFGALVAKYAEWFRNAG